MLALYIFISLTNVFLHIVRSIMVIKSGKLTASLANCVCYTFSAVVIKFIAETDLWTAIAVLLARHVVLRACAKKQRITLISLIKRINLNS